MAFAFAPTRLEWLLDDLERAQAALRSLEAAPVEGRWRGTPDQWRARLSACTDDVAAAEAAVAEWRAREESAAELAESYREKGQT